MLHHHRNLVFLGLSVVVLFFATLNLINIENSLYTTGHITTVIFVTPTNNSNRNMTLCVFIPSYRRPHNLKHSLPYLDSCAMVSQIVVAHGDEAYFNDSIQSSKITHVRDWQNNEQWFTLRRFLTSTAYCTSDHILIVDDDLLPSEQYMHRLMNEYRSDTSNVYGPTARKCSQRGYFTNPKAVGARNYDVILSGLMLAHKRVIEHVFNAINSSAVTAVDITTHAFMQTVMTLKGNGEDLLWNYVFIKLYKKRPVCVPFSGVAPDVMYLDDGNGFYTSDPQEHRAQRDLMCQRFFANITYG